MTLNDLTQSTGEWLRGTGPMSDVVISSRVRLARNIADSAFLSTASGSERTKIHRRLAHEVSETPMGATALVLDMEELDPIDRDLLVERHLVSRQHSLAEGSRGVTITPDETQALMINEEDHLRIQGLRSGLELGAVWEDVNRIDDELAKRIPFAFDKQLGYLTACPTNVGDRKSVV